MEDTCLVKTCSLDLSKFGFRWIDLLIATNGGTLISVGNELLKNDRVLSVERTIGEHAIDLMAETIVMKNAELLDLLEEMEAMKGVRDVIWTEVTEIIGEKNPPNHVARFLSGQK